MIPIKYHNKIIVKKFFSSFSFFEFAILFSCSIIGSGERVHATLETWNASTWPSVHDDEQGNAPPSRGAFPSSVQRQNVRRVLQHSCLGQIQRKRTNVLVRVKRSRDPPS